MSRAPPLTTVEHSDDTSESLVDVDSIHVSTVPSDFESQEVKTDTQAERLEQEREDLEREMEVEYEQRKREAKAKAHEAKVKTQQAAQEARHQTEEATKKAADKTADKVSQGADKVSRGADKVSKEAKSAGREIHENSDNPVIIGNAVVVAALSAALGFGAYRKYAAGELTWKVVGAWAGVVGLFAAGDFYLSQYLFKNRYPRK
ncbi:MAG: hypothetical protein M1823_001713 [Watsoniomyces obsoletus]|nr:MAG: hypothetical protein M1823_001713 [Watsoniomyces obsoletus]